MPHFAAVESSYRHARIWNATNGRLELDVTHDAALVLAVAFSPDGTQLATGASDNTARIWNAADG